MTADRRRYIRVTVDMARNPKLLALQPAHRWLYLEALCHCGEYLTDGRLTPSAMASLGGSLGVSLARNNAWRALEREGLIEPLEDEPGYRIRDYLEHQESRDQVEQLRAKRQQAGSKGGAAKANAVASARAVAKQELQQTPSDVDVDVKKELTTYAPRAPRSAPPEAKAHRLPEDWEPSEADIAYALERGIDESRFTDIAENFRAHWLNKPGKDGRKINWSMTWQTWVRNEQKWATNSKSRGDSKWYAHPSGNGKQTFASGALMPWER